MDITLDDFIVHEGEDIDLAVRPTKIDDIYKTKDGYEDLLRADVKRLSELQRVLYADDSRALLLIFQGMDTAGKDGVIRHVMSGVNPQGCEVSSFKQPSYTELQHDFLWRTYRRLPERGRIGIFNRSYYEEVLVVRVHPELLVNQGLPRGVEKRNGFWAERYRSIVDMERHLNASGTKILKFFLHLSKDEQRKRFLDRIDEPEKNWKFSQADIVERRSWNRYMRAYAACLGGTSTADAPWFVVPADDKENARLIVSHIILRALDAMDLRYPRVTAERRKTLLELRKKLAK